MEARDWHQASPPVLPLSFGNGGLPEPEARCLARLTVYQVPENSFHPGLPSAGITHVFLPCPAFYVGSRDLDSDPPIFELETSQP